MKLYEVYIEMLNEVGELDPSKAYRFILARDTVSSETNEAGQTYPVGIHFYEFVVPNSEKWGKSRISFGSDPARKDNVTMGVQIQYGIDQYGNNRPGSVRIDFGIADGPYVGEIPIIGKDFRSAYGIMNTVGTVVKDSLKRTIDMGRATTLITQSKKEYSKKNPTQRQDLYSLFIKKAIPGVELSDGGSVVTLPKDYDRYL